jgi:hypothetical protein
VNISTTSLVSDVLAHLTTSENFVDVEPSPVHNKINVMNALCRRANFPSNFKLSNKNMNMNNLWQNLHQGFSMSSSSVVEHVLQRCICGDWEHKRSDNITVATSAKTGWIEPSIFYSHIQSPRHKTRPHFSIHPLSFRCWRVNCRRGELVGIMNVELKFFSGGGG